MPASIGDLLTTQSLAKTAADKLHMDMIAAMVELNRVIKSFEDAHIDDPSQGRELAGVYASSFTSQIIHINRGNV